MIAEKRNLFFCLGADAHCMPAVTAGCNHNHSGSIRLCIQGLKKLKFDLSMKRGSRLPTRASMTALEVPSSANLGMRWKGCTTSLHTSSLASPCTTPCLSKGHTIQRLTAAHKHMLLGSEHYTTCHQSLQLNMSRCIAKPCMGIARLAITAVLSSG